MLQTDFEYIIAVLDGKTPEIGISDWYSVLGFLELNRVGVMFLDNAVRQGLAVPADVLTVLRTRKREYANKCGIFLDYILKIGGALEERGITRYAFVKGAVLANALIDKTVISLCHFHPVCMHGEPSRRAQVYAPGERTSNDIDILIGPENLTAADEVLRSLGFAQGYWDGAAEQFVSLSRKDILLRRMNRGETAPYILVTGDPVIKYIEVDVNFSPDGLPAGREQLLKDMLDFSKVYQGRTPGVAIRSLAPEYLLVHLLLHQHKEDGIYSMVKRGKSDTLYKYADIRRILKNRQFGGIAFYNAVKRYCLEAETCHVLGAIEEIYGYIDSPEAVVIMQENAAAEPQIVIDYDNAQKRYVYKSSVRERLLTRSAEGGLLEYEGGI